MQTNLIKPMLLGAKIEISWNITVMLIIDALQLKKERCIL